MRRPFTRRFCPTGTTIPIGWTKGASDARARANVVWKELLRGYEPPPLDPARTEALDAYVARRKEEGGAPMN